MLMEEDNPYAEGLSYTEDVPYEAQIDEMPSVDPVPEATGNGQSLRKRIGNRIYLVDDMLLKRKKRLEDEVDDEDIERANSDLSLRSNALLLKGPPITLLPTERIFTYAVHFNAHPIGLEWVDDETCVLVFSSRKAAVHGWNALRKPDATETVRVDSMDTDEPEFHKAHLLPTALLPIEERITSVLGNQRSEVLKQPIRIRWARIMDTKSRDSKNKSEFYKRFGESAGKPAPPGSSAPSGTDNSYGAYVRKLNVAEAKKRQLDAELDEFLKDDEEQQTNVRTGGRRGSRQSHNRPQTVEERQLLLDMELDNILAGNDVEEAINTGEEAPGPSLLERTRSQLPRRQRRPSRVERPRRSSRSRSPIHGDQDKKQNGREYQTDENGRWLHNAEVTARKRSVSHFDPRRFGMRAWNDDPPRRLPKKTRKTQEELDRELEEFTASY